MKVAARGQLQANQRALNYFAIAKDLALSDSDIDKFIDPSVVGNDRVMARKLLALQPAGMRGDFVALAQDGHIITNNPSMLPYVTVTRGSVDAPKQRDQNVKKSLDYSNSCSPPNPPGKPGGPYDRQVSKCGFATGWGFVSVPCGTSNFAAGDAGHLYFEIQGPGGSAVEGGLEYYSDSSIAPYLRSTAVSSNAGYIGMNNATARYFCNQTLGIFHGIVPNLYQTYTIVGQLSPSQDPRTVYITGALVQLIQPSWLFYAIPPDFTGGGTDAANNPAPCMQCSVSEVTSIAQNGLSSGQGYSLDNSTFGIDSVGDNAIHWMQVAFGQWTSACVPGAASCPFVASNNPYVYYGGEQDYPNAAVSGASTDPLGYGAYESYDGISLTSGAYYSNGRRAAAGAFTAPLPPTPTPVPVGTPTPRPRPTPNPCVKNPRNCMAPVRTPTPSPTKTPH